MDQRFWGKSSFASLLCQLKQPVSRMKEISILLHQQKKSCIESVKQEGLFLI